MLQAEKDFNLASHPEIEGVPNLQVSFISCIWGTDMQFRDGMVLCSEVVGSLLGSLL